MYLFEILNEKIEEFTTLYRDMKQLIFTVLIEDEDEYFDVDDELN